MIPQHIEAEKRWRSMWNGAGFSTRRIQAGTIIGLGGLLQWLSLHRIARAMPPGVPRNLAVGSAAAFGLSGLLTHLGCGLVILDYQQAAVTDQESTAGSRPSPRSKTGMLGVSAVALLAALALFSASQTIRVLGHGSTAPTVRSLITPVPCVLAPLLTFGALPAPIGGYLRPASMSTGLAVYFAITAVTAEN